MFLQVNNHLKGCVDNLIEHGTATVHGVNISYVGVSVFFACCNINAVYFTQFQATTMQFRMFEMYKAAYDIVVQSTDIECFIWKLFLISEIGYDEMREINKRASSASRRGQRAEVRLSRFARERSTHSLHFSCSLARCLPVRDAWHNSL